MTPDINRVLNELYLQRGEGVAGGLNDGAPDSGGNIILENREIIVISDEVEQRDKGYYIPETIVLSDYAYNASARNQPINEYVTLLDEVGAKPQIPPIPPVSPQIILGDEVFVHPVHRHGIPTVATLPSAIEPPNYGEGVTVPAVSVIRSNNGGTPHWGEVAGGGSGWNSWDDVVAPPNRIGVGYDVIPITSLNPAFPNLDGDWGFIRLSEIGGRTYTGGDGIDVTGTVISADFGTAADTVAEGDHGHTGLPFNPPVVTTPVDANDKLVIEVDDSYARVDADVAVTQILRNISGETDEFLKRTASGIEWAVPTGGGTAGVSSLTAGGGLAVNRTTGAITISLDLDNLTYATPIATDSVAFIDESATGDPTRLTRIDTLLSLASSSGPAEYIRRLSVSGNTLSWDSEGGIDGSFSPTGGSGGGLSSVGVGTGLDVSTSSGVATISLDLSEVSTSTPTLDDYVVFLDDSLTGDPERKARIRTILGLGGGSGGWDSWSDVPLPSSAIDSDVLSTDYVVIRDRSASSWKYTSMVWPLNAAMAGISNATPAYNDKMLFYDLNGIQPRVKATTPYTVVDVNVHEVTQAVYDATTTKRGFYIITDAE